MSVIINLSIFPMDKGESVSSYVARAVNIIKESGLQYNFGPMGTSIEGEWDEVMGVVNRCFEDLKKDCNRIYLNLNADYRKGAPGRIKSKVTSVEKKI
jgi:uncharacterized protein (TIGR00106 family)